MRLCVVGFVAAFACLALAGFARTDARPVDARAGDEVVFTLVPTAPEREEDGRQPVRVVIRAATQAKGREVYNFVRPLLDRKTIRIEVEVIKGHPTAPSAIITPKADVSHNVLFGALKTLRAAGVDRVTLMER